MNIVCGILNIGLYLVKFTIMPRINFTALEVDAIRSAALNMQDDFEDYFSFHPDIKRYHDAFMSGMAKLWKHSKEARALTPEEEQSFNYETENSDEAKRR